VRRKDLGLDLGLGIRMLFVGGIIGVLYLALAALAVWIVWLSPGETGSWAAAALIFGGILAHFLKAEQLVLSAARARVVGRDEAPELHALVERLCGLADLPKPRLAVSESDVPNAFAAGMTPGRSTVAVTRGLWNRLERGELEAVLAHELSHVANRDAIVVTSASLFPTIGAWLGRWRFGTSDFRRRERDWREYLIWPFLITFALLLYAFGAVLTFAISRYREYAADRGAAMITGAPEQLMSALQKISGEMALIPKRDLRALAGLNAFFIIPAARPRRFELSMDHPPLEKRLRELAAIARELGRPVR
jgi:heat shock protein HtpX